MVFKELRIVDKQLILDVDLTEMKYFNNAKLNAIQIDTAKSFNEDVTGAYTYEVNPATQEFSKTFAPADFVGVDGHTLAETEAQGFGDIVFVQLQFDGVEKPNAPCGIHSTVYGIAVNWKKIYDQGINFAREVESDCSNKAGFIDYVLRLKAFESAVKFGDVNLANKLFKFFSGNNSSNKGCGCSR